MIKLLLLSFLLSSCGLSNEEKEVLIRKATTYCTCKGGLDYLWLSPSLADSLAYCKDGSRLYINVNDYIPKRECKQKVLWVKPNK